MCVQSRRRGDEVPRSSAKVKSFQACLSRAEIGFPDSPSARKRLSRRPIVAHGRIEDHGRKMMEQADQRAELADGNQVGDLQLVHTISCLIERLLRDLNVKCAGWLRTPKKAAYGNLLFCFSESRRTDKEARAQVSQGNLLPWISGPPYSISCGRQVPDVGLPHYRDARMQHCQSTQPALFGVTTVVAPKGSAITTNGVFPASPM